MLAVPRSKATNHRQIRKDITHMNTVTRWEPVKSLEDLQNRLSSLFGPAPVRRRRRAARARLAHKAPIV